MPQTLHIITGPTAVGKTETALRWAEENDAEILYCDSLCFYKGMDIGTAKPTPEEQARIPHHGIDLVNPSQAYDINDYISYAIKTIEDIHARGKRVLISGGSGFYLQSFYRPTTDNITISETLKAEIANMEAEGGLPAIRAALLELNPNGVGNLDLQNPARVRNALARCRASGLSVTELRKRFNALSSPFDAFPKYTVVLQRDKNELTQRIAKRVQIMLDTGLIDEVKSLLKKNIESNPSAASAIGYRETIRWIRQGEENLTQLAADIIQNTQRLAKKQRTWFARQIPVDEWIDLSK